MSHDPVAPLFLDFSADGLAELDAAIAFLSDSLGSEYAERLTSVMGSVVAAACLRIAGQIVENGRPFDARNETASLRFARPVYRERVEMSKSRSRRSSAGLWYVYYSLEDRHRSGNADTLVIVAVRHAASQPFTIQSPADESP